MIFKILFAVLIALFIFILLCYYFYGDYFKTQRYRLHVVCGKKGCGKSTYIQKLIIQANKEGRPVYCNFEMPFSRKIEMKDFGNYAFPPESLILLDEISLFYDNRNFAKFNQKITDYLRYQRHFKNEVWIFSQSKDMDKKFIDLADCLYLQVKVLGLWTVLKKVNKRLTVDNGQDSQGNAGGKIIESYTIAPFFSSGARIISFIPRWSGFFNSFETPETDFIPYVDKQPSEINIFLANDKTYKKIRNARYRFRVLSSLASIGHNTKHFLIDTKISLLNKWTKITDFVTGKILLCLKNLKKY